MNPTLEILVSLSYILVLVFLGVGLRIVAGRDSRLSGPLKKTFNFLNALVIWVILPSVVFVSIARYTGGELFGFINAFILAFLTLGFCFVSSVVLSLRAKDDRNKTIALALNSSFMNVTYLGFPAVYVMLVPRMGPDAMASAALYGMGVGIPNIIFGTMLASTAAKKKITSRTVIMKILTFPAAFALVAALLFVGFNAPIPSVVHQTFNTYLTLPFFAIMLIVVGYQVPIVNPRKYFGELLTVGSFRFLISPLLTFVVIALLGLDIVTDKTPKPSLLQSAMPPAVFNMILATKYKLDTKLYGALVFYLTLFSLLVVLPVISFFIAR